jgi:ABC-type glycerol-3-phosphate transport system substrate-binding protein
MKTIKKKLILILILSIFSLSFGGCQRKSTETSTTINPEKIELTFYNLFDDSDAFTGQIQAFRSLHPNITIRYEKFTTPEEYENLIINELAEGRGPDIFAIHNTWIEKHKNKLVPMPIDLPISMNTAKFRQTFFNVAADDLIIDEQIYGLPLSIDTLALYYNQQYLASAVPGTNKPATTWENLKKQVIALTKKDKSKERFSVTGIAMGRADNIIQAIDILYLLFLEYETMFYDRENKVIFAQQQGVIEGTGQPYFPGVLALDLYTSFGLPSFNHYSWNDVITGADPEQKEINVFARGKTAMIFGYTYLYQDLQRVINNLQKTNQEHIEISDIRINEVPQVLDPIISNKRIALASYYPLVVSKNSTHQQAAWEFVQFITSKDSLQTYFDQTHKTTSRLDMQEEQVLDPIYGAFARQAQYAKSYKIIDDAFFSKVFTKAIADVLNTVDILKALQSAEQSINCLINKKTGQTQYREINCGE